MIANLALSKEALIKQVKAVINTKDFQKAVRIPELNIKIIDERLYWGLGKNPGYVVVDVMAEKVYRVFEISEPLSDHSLCSPEMALLVFEDLQDLIQSINLYNASQAFDQVMSEIFSLGSLRDSDLAN
ncbi:hypothetical protein A2572_00055 [Candidatus Collierbacteria bacterium RIFOXYD1_FULL_40_9]|uniref:Uncharacterized protein n=1 Tax=Candidatus Collierbacteria bacterium RIFOXYD1_FULL_40_9 TaxID=1817731 RepID=A0A1F5FWF0_9BACT|nr:MAG: hypothetical protein A2572_00055 [Candidatus Collierbacteria bacterium RIFOXYD1_FULL_40_9]